MNGPRLNLRDMPPERRRWVFGALGLVALALLAWVIFHKAPAKASAPRAVPVTATRAVAQDFQLSINALGAAQAWTSDTVFAQVSGKLISVNFKEGSNVRAGQVLAEVDPRPYEAALQQAEGTLKRDTAQLEGARRDLARYQHLQAEGGVSRQVYEDEVATVAQDEGTVSIDQGAVAAAKLNLEWCRITSPINGRAGVRLVDPGNLVSASGSVSNTPSTAAPTSSASAGGSSGGSSSGTGIVLINQIQPIAVTFTVPEGDFQRLVDVSNGFSKTLVVQAFSQETGALEDVGELRIADNRVDPNSGAVELKARFPNPNRRLWPGQFVNVRLFLQTLPNATVIPLAAVNRGPKGPYVFLIGSNMKVSLQPVTLTTSLGGNAVIASGLKPGDMVVTDGQMTLAAGSLVRVSKGPGSPAAGPKSPTAQGAGH